MYNKFKNFKNKIFLFVLTLILTFFLFKFDLHEIFIGETKELFGDHKLYISWIKCDYLGFDAYKNTDCGSGANYGPVANYGPLFFIVPFNLDLESFYLNQFPFIVIITFLFFCSFQLNPKNKYEFVICLLSIFNPVTFLAIERLNFDLLIFLGIIFIVYNRLYLINWIIIFFLTLVKIYPFFLILNILNENKKRKLLSSLVITITVISLMLLYIYLNFDTYYYDVINSGGAKAGLHLLFSIKALAKIIKYLIHINYVISLPIILIIFLYLTKMLYQILNTKKINDFIDLNSHKTRLYALSAIIIVFCYLIFSNYFYREIFLILILPLLFQIKQLEKNKVVNSYFNLIFFKCIFIFIYGYFNVYESFYHIDGLRYYSKTFIIVGLIKSIIDIIQISIILSLFLIIFKKTYNYILSEGKKSLTY